MFRWLEDRSKISLNSKQTVGYSLYSLQWILNIMSSRTDHLSGIKRKTPFFLFQKISPTTITFSPLHSSRHISRVALLNVGILNYYLQQHCNRACEARKHIKYLPESIFYSKRTSCKSKWNSVFMVVFVP